MLRKIRALPKIKKVFIRSGIRYDYILADKKDDFLEELCRWHVSGQLKIAPEHISPNVLRYMRKPGRAATEEFMRRYAKVNAKLGLKQFLVPYFISAHPGSTLKEAVELAEFIRDSGLRPEQVQDFTPTPGSLSTCIYYTGLDPFTLEEVYVPKGAGGAQDAARAAPVLDAGKPRIRHKGAHARRPPRPDRQRPKVASSAAERSYGQ